MILIAHRGLTTGPDQLTENHPSQITSSLEQGFDCEVDLRVINNQLFLGHDSAQYEVDHTFIKNSKLWIHCKNLEALDLCQKIGNLNYFWHDTDSYTLTSKGYIWAYPGKLLTNQSVQVMPEWSNPGLENLDLDCFGICSDFVLEIKNKMPKDVDDAK